MARSKDPLVAINRILGEGEEAELVVESADVVSRENTIANAAIAISHSIESDKKAGPVAKNIAALLLCTIAASVQSPSVSKKLLANAKGLKQ